MLFRHARTFYATIWLLTAALVVLVGIARLAGCIEFYQPPQGITDGELGR